MKALFLTFAMATLASAVSAAPPTLKLASIRSVATMGTSIVLVLPGIAYTAEASTLRLEGDCLVLTGSYSSHEFTPALKPTVHTDEWKVADGSTHKVVTDCTGMSAQPCLDQHKLHVDLAKKMWPPVKD